MTIYSIGSSRRTEEEFVEILSAYKINLLIDVRSFPVSKLEHFRKENLEWILKEAGIGYQYLGRQLGGYRKGGYEAYTGTEDFKNGIDKLEELASQVTSVFMCAERFPWKCHRRFVARALGKRGCDVVHIIEKDRVWIPKGKMKKERQFRFKKALGQHFLFDKDIINKILDKAKLKATDTVLEIGPGPGVMTRMIGERVRKVIAIEIDKALCERLKIDFLRQPNIEIVNADALHYPYETLEKGFKVIANLPYYITTPILFRLLEAKVYIKSMTLMVQKEVAERIVSRPKGKDYGLLSIAVQYYSIPKIAFIVPRSLFRPPPQVDSALLQIEIPERPRIKVKDETFFFKVVKASFSQRRKTIFNSLSASGISKDTLNMAFSRLGIDHRRRPETLSLEEFGMLSDLLITN